MKNDMKNKNDNMERRNGRYLIVDYENLQTKLVNGIIQNLEDIMLKIT